MINNWHELTTETVLSVTKADLVKGLSEAIVADRLKQWGYNELVGQKRESWLVTFFKQFHDVLIYVLLLSALITSLLGELMETAVILGVVIINSIFGAIQEKKAQKEIDAIKQMLAPNAEVIRDGKSLVVPARELVEGDIVLLKSGDIVPADLRLVEVNSLQIREAILTGESNNIHKNVEATAELAPLGDRYCIAYSGTEVVAGRGKGIVVATGNNTELGKINAMVKNISETATPLTQQMGAFSKWLTIAIVLLANFTFLYGVFFWHYGINAMFMVAVGLAVAAIPEGLPPTLTIILALGVQRMAKFKAIVRKLLAVETMGAITTICTDKTGTLTENIQTIKQIVTGKGSVEVVGGILKLQDEEIILQENPALNFMLESGILCNDLLDKHDKGQQIQHGNAIDQALLRLGEELKIDFELLKNKYPRLDLIPYESEHRLMASLHRNHNGENFVLVKGAPEKILSACVEELQGNSSKIIQVDYWFDQIDNLASQGYRLLAIAYKPLTDMGLSFGVLNQDLVLLGLFVLTDPPRREVIPALEACRQADIKVKMITGDYAITAKTIAQQIGIDCSAGVLTGAEIDQLDDATLSEKINLVNVFARTSPRHKLRLVELLQQAGEIVAMTGDGANDAPALSKANIGVAMGQKGADIAKEAGEIVLADDNFATIVKAIEAGRVVYDNVKKVILHILPTNAAEALVIVVSIVFGLTLPITALQILWVNMITSITLSLTLGFEKAEDKIMQRVPRDIRLPLLEKWIIVYMAFVTGLLVFFVFGIFYYELKVEGGSLEVARSVAVNMLIFGEAAFLFNCRKFYAGFLKSGNVIKENPVMILSLLVMVLFQICFTYSTFMQQTFKIAALIGRHWFCIISSCCLLFMLAEGVKFFITHYLLPEIKLSMNKDILQK